jgi:hypothetical protein
MLGAKVGALISLGVILATSTAVSAAEIAAVTLFPIPVGAAVAIAAIMPTAIALGAVIGGKKGKETQEKEYALAIKQRNAQKTIVSPSVNQNLEQAFEQNPSKNHTTEIIAERARAESKQRQL